MAAAQKTVKQFHRTTERNFNRRYQKDYQVCVRRQIPESSKEKNTFVLEEKNKTFQKPDAKHLRLEKLRVYRDERAFKKLGLEKKLNLKSRFPPPPTIPTPQPKPPQPPTAQSSQKPAVAKAASVGLVASSVKQKTVSRSASCRKSARSPLLQANAKQSGKLTIEKQSHSSKCTNVEGTKQKEVHSNIDQGTSYPIDSPDFASDISCIEPVSNRFSFAPDDFSFTAPEGVENFTAYKPSFLFKRESDAPTLSRVSTPMPLKAVSKVSRQASKGIEAKASDSKTSQPLQPASGSTCKKPLKETAVRNSLPIFRKAITTTGKDSSDLTNHPKPKSQSYSRKPESKVDRPLHIVNSQNDSRSPQDLHGMKTCKQICRIVTKPEVVSSQTVPVENHGRVQDKQPEKLSETPEEKSHSGKSRQDSKSVESEAKSAERKREALKTEDAESSRRRKNSLQKNPVYSELNVSTCFIEDEILDDDVCSKLEALELSPCSHQTCVSSVHASSFPTACSETTQPSHYSTPPEERSIASGRDSCSAQTNKKLNVLCTETNGDMEHSIPCLTTEQGKERGKRHTLVSVSEDVTSEVKENGVNLMNTADDKSSGHDVKNGCDLELSFLGTPPRPLTEKTGSLRGDLIWFSPAPVRR